MPAELDLVVLKRDLPEAHLAAGDIGTVVYRHAADLFEVEFVAWSGETAAVLTLSADTIRPVGATEILHARARVP